MDKNVLLILEIFLRWIPAEKGVSWDPFLQEKNNKIFAGIT